VRGRLAALVALGAIPTLALSTHSAWSSGGGGGVGGMTGASGAFDYTYDLGARSLGPKLALTAVAVLLTVAAAMLWSARSRRVVAGGGMLAVVCAAAAVVIAGAGEHHGTPTLAALNSIPIGAPRAAVVRQLGAPLVQADTTATGGGPLPVCLVYALDQRGARPTGPGPVAVPSADLDSIPPGTSQAVLCFTLGRLSQRLPA
jgi:hypothetical protein